MLAAKYRMRFIELHESTSYLLLETPQRLAWLITNRGPNLLAKYEEEKQHGVIAMETARHIELIDGENPTEKLVKFIMSFDPTPGKNYSNWLCSRYMAKPEKGGCRLEDLNARVTADLAMFERVSRSRRIENGNIDAYKSLQALEDVIEPFREGDREVSNRADRAAGRSTREITMFPASDPLRNDHHVITLLDTPDLLILQLKTEEAARHFGENTSWCTTSGMFNHYNETSPLYVICDRKKNTRVQFHFNGSNSQFMDERDRSIKLNDYLKEHPPVFKVFRQQFLAMVGVTTYGGDTISPDFFTPEDLADAPASTLVRMLQKASDLDKFPRILSDEGFKAMAHRRPSAKHNHWEARNYGQRFEEAPYQRIMNKFFKALKPKFFIEYMMEDDENMWLWKFIPAKWKTDKVNDLLLESLIRWNTASGLITDIQNYFGDRDADDKMWTDKIRAAFWDAAASVGWSSENFPEEEFTDERMVKVLGANPDEIDQFIERLNPKIVASIIRNTASDDVHTAFEHLPPEYRNKEAAKALHQQAGQFKAKRDQGQRDQFLRALTHFDHEHWGRSAQRIAELFTGDFSKLPAQFQTKEFAAKLVSEQPIALKRIPAAFIDQNVVNRALVYGRWSWVLDECDPHVITPEMVLEGVKYALDNPLRDAPINHSRDEALALPKVYKTYRPMLDYLLSTATLPMDDEDWPEDAWTPETVLKKVRLAVRGARPRRYVDSSWYGHRRGNYNSNAHSVKEAQQRWDQAFESIWATVPDIAKKPEIVAAITKEFPHAVTMMDKALLTNDILNIWMEATEKDASEGAASFPFFPKTAWSNETLATALKRGYITEIPEEFKDKEDDETLVQMIASDKAHKSVDWSKITPEILVSAIDKSTSYTAIITRVPKDSPLLDNEEVVFAALRHAVDDERGFGPRYYSSELQKIWPPEKRGHWKQRDWDLAGGNIVPLDEIPPKFKHDNLTVKSVLRNAKNLDHIENKAKWLNENSDAITTAKGFNVDSWLAEGIYFDGKHWFDDKKEKHTEGPGGGSYSYVETSTGAKIVYLYDKKGNLLEGFAANLKTGESYSQSTVEFVSKYGNRYGGNTEALKSLVPYRDMVEAVLEKYPVIMQAMMGSHWSSGHLEPLGFHRTPDDRLVMREKLPRQKIEGTDLTYVVPNPNRYGGTVHVIYDGSEINAKVAAKIVLDTGHRGGNRFESATVFGTGADHIRWSEGFKNFMYGPGDVASGSGPKFKESDLYRSCGVRGTGNFEWFTLFGEKIMEHGGMSMWRQGRVVSIADEDHGLVATGKKAKDGSFTMTEKFAEDMDDAKLEKIFALMKGKL